MVHIEAKTPNNRKYPPIPARTVSAPLEEYNGRDSRYVAAWVAGVLCVFALALLVFAVTL